ncbi:MAG: YggS family pyridoxal phosphate-dependent enzyme [Candidatus Omnitrophota bacterium]
MISENLKIIRDNIAAVCQRAKQSKDEITIVVVTKTATIEDIKEVIGLGIQDIGENRVQEATVKFSRLPALKWHMVGHLQTNKARDAVKLFSLIHSVDSLRLAMVIDEEARKINKVQEILIEVNTSDEATKFGLKPEEAIETVKEIASLKNLNLKGLMTIAPIVDKPDNARPYFRALRGLKDKINEFRVTRDELQVLSMGMTDDYQIAIEEGATMVRLGRAIFGNTD